MNKLNGEYIELIDNRATHINIYLDGQIIGSECINPYYYTISAGTSVQIGNSNSIVTYTGTSAPAILSAGNSGISMRNSGITYAPPIIRLVKLTKLTAKIYGVN